MQVTVYFTPGSASLNDIAKTQLGDEVAGLMTQDPRVRVKVIGHPSAGADDATPGISEQRAEAVENYLITRYGIDPNRITTQGRGSAESTGSPERDRRAVAIVTSR